MYTSPASSPITTPRATPSSELTSSPTDAVALSENRDVMSLVTGDDIDERAHRDAVAAGRPRPGKRRGVQRPYERQSAVPHVPILGDEVRQRPLIEPGHRHPRVLLEGGERRLVAAG